MEGVSDDNAGGQIAGFQDFSNGTGFVEGAIGLTGCRNDVVGGDALADQFAMDKEGSWLLKSIVPDAGFGGDDAGNFVVTVKVRGLGNPLRATAAQLNDGIGGAGGVGHNK